MRYGLFAITLLAAFLEFASVSEKIEVYVVNVDVTVSDKHGQPVRGLTRDDFQVFEDGKPQRITNFYVVEAGMPHEQDNPPKAPRVPQGRFRRKALLLVDNNFIDKVRSDAALAQFEKFVGGSFTGEYELAVGVVGGGARIVQPFTAERAKIQEAIELIRHSAVLAGPSIGNADASMGKMTSNESERRLERFRRSVNAATSLEALRQSALGVIAACRSYSALDGKKLVVLISGGMQIDNRPPADDPTEQMHWLMTARENAIETGKILETMVHEANAADFAIYVINANGLESPHPVDVAARAPDYGASGDFASVHPTRDFDSFPMALSEQTGGAYMTSNDFAASVLRMNGLSANYYSVGYSPSHGDDGKYHSIGVRLPQKNVNVSYRAGYASLSADQRLKRALAEFLAIDTLPRDLPMELEVGLRRPIRGGSRAVVTVAIPVTRLIFLPDEDREVGRVHIYVSLFNSRGENLGVIQRSQDIVLGESGLKKAKAIGSKIRFPLEVDLKRSTSRLVVAVRDDTRNQIGVALYEGLAQP